MHKQRRLLFLTGAVLLAGLTIASSLLGSVSAAQITARSLTLQGVGTTGGAKAGGTVNHLFSFTIPSDTNINIKAKNGNLLGYAELGLSNPHLNINNSTSATNLQDKGAVRIRYA